MCSEDGNKVPATKLRIKFGPNCWVKTFQIKDPKKFEDEFFSSKKRRAQDIEKVGTKKKQKCDLSSQCLRLLMDHQFGWIFSEPVKLNIPDYLTVVSKPMDLGTIQSKLLRNSYKNDDEFAADVRLIFTNAMLYYSSDNLIHKAAKQLKETFELRWKKAQADLLKPVLRSLASVRLSAESPKPVLKDGVKVQKSTKVFTPKEIFEVGPKKSVAQGSVRAAILKCQFAETIMRAKRKKALDQQSNKPDLVSIRIEKEQMEKRQRKAELKEMRDRERAELENMVIGYDLDEKYNFSRVHMDWVKICGTSYMTRNRLPELGLVLRNDDEATLFEAVDGVEEGEIV